MTAAETVEHFRTHGWVRIPRAFSGTEASAMREVVWDELARVGIRPDDPSTWTVERPVGLQALKGHPAFGEVGSQRLRTAIDALLGEGGYEAPKRWGAVFVAFPTREPWSIPVAGWHIDANYRSQLWPPKGVQVHSLFGDVAPRAGGSLIVSGSHRLIHRWFTEHPPPPDARSAELRRAVMDHPYIRALHTRGDGEARIARFMDRTEEVDGVPLRVIENRGEAGDVMLLHPLTLHVAAPNTGSQPRFLLSGAVTTDMHGWG